MKNKHLFLISLLTAGCVTQTQKQQANSINDSMLLAASPNDSIQKITTYVYEDDSILQEAKINYLSKKEIHFLLTSKSKKTGKIYTKDGTAQSNPDMDYEIDEDEDGTAYPSEQYIYDQQCWLSFRISVKPKDKLRILETNCDDLHDKECPFASVGVLKQR